MTETKWVDYYYILELYDPINKTGKGPDSTPEEIKQARKKMAKRWHDDAGDAREGSDLWKHANEQMRLVNQAYSVLRDPEKKTAYDKEWHKKNPWFNQQGEGGAASADLPEISIRWEPVDALSNLFYNIPRGVKRRAKLHIEPRVGKGFLVEIKEPETGWLKIISPKNRRATVPFIVEIEVDTSNLVYGREYDGELEFVLEDL